MTLLSKNFKVPRSVKLQSLSLDGFAGGMNTVDSDIAMDPRFVVLAKNFRRSSDRGMDIRFGSRWFADIDAATAGDIIDMEFFSNAIIAVTDAGEVASINDSGTVAAIWNSAIAAALLGAPSGWSSGLTIVDFVKFKSELVIHNGIDKPISINSSLVTRYLQDAATGSNTNVPIGSYGCVVANYHCVAGIPAAPTTIYIASKGTSGTFIGDPPPNDSISIDVGAYAPEGAPEIRGIAGYRSLLIVFFQDQSMVIKLGVYDQDGNHTPTFPDAMPAYGLVSHRCIAFVENDLLFGSPRGIASAKKNLYLADQMDTQPISDYIEPTYRQQIGNFTDAQLKQSSFMFYDNILHDTTMQLPSGVAFLYSANERLRYKAWTQYEGNSWSAACVSTKGRTFFADGTRIFKSGNNVYTGEAYRADRIDDRDDVWHPGTFYSAGDLIRDTDVNASFLCIADHTSGAVSFAQDRADQALSPKWEAFEGYSIDFELEGAWLNSKDPMQIKMLQFVRVGTKGTAEFTFRAWVDNLYKDVDGNVVFNPAVSINFIGNDAPGFGYDAGPYGGGRRSADPRLYGFPVKFKTLKPGIIGSTRDPLHVVGMSFLYMRGRYHR
jgi:hypothetical protein